MEAIENIEIAKQLIKGSRNIDRMRSEIEQLVKMLIGYVRQTSGGRKVSLFCEQESDSPSGMCKWYVHGIVGGKPEEETLLVDCRVHDKHTGNMVLAFTSSDRFASSDKKKPEVKLSVEDVQAVHESLSTLVECLLCRLPSLSEKWEPLLRASTAFD